MLRATRRDLSLYLAEAIFDVIHGFQNTSRVSHGGTSRGEGRILAASPSERRQQSPLDPLLP